jgi:hypothetical protein
LIVVAGAVVFWPARHPVAPQTVPSPPASVERRPPPPEYEVISNAEATALLQTQSVLILSAPNHQKQVVFLHGNGRINESENRRE